MAVLALFFVVLFDCGHANDAEVIFGPSSPTDWSSWFNSISVQRTKDLKSINYNGSIFNVSQLDWTQSSFVGPVHMAGYDKYFYDLNTNSYTVGKWINDLNNRYGGIDSFLFWVTYTNLGIDDRNQFEMTLSVPGSMSFLKNMTNYFHKQNPSIKVIFPYHPWDTGTKPSGDPDYITMAKFLNNSEADGFYGDTMSSVPQNFYTYSVNTYNNAIAIDPEGGGSLESMNWDTIGRGYWPVTNYKPSAGKWKFYDGRHMTVLCDNRWTHNHTNDIQNAYFNGIGFESWENLWGCWNEIVPRDAGAVRRVATILRYFGNRNNNPTQRNFTQDLGWKPFIPIISEKKYWNTVFASQFTVDGNTDTQQILFLIVNRNNKDVNNVEIVYNNTFGVEFYVYDCYHGLELNYNKSNELISVNVDIESLGYGCLLTTMDKQTDNQYLNEFLITMNNITQKPLNDYSSKWNFLQQEMKRINTTILYSSPPNGSVVIPWGLFQYESNGVEIEGNNESGVDVQYSFEMYPQREHSQYMVINQLFIDKYPVTCNQYKQYLISSNYQPKDSYNYLKNWNYSNNEYNYPDGYDNKPVTYLGINEARLYCEYYQKRLPHSYELAFAGRGNTSYIYPWGNNQNMGINFPNTQHERTLPGPVNVGKYSPEGDSMFGVGDLVGNVWQYTDEFSDIHTRAVILRGSANYRPNGSKWYFPTAYELTQHNKYFLMDNSYERAGTIGFRCVADAIQPTNGLPSFWNNGKGRFCVDNHLTKNKSVNGILCGRFRPQKGYNNLTESGGLDWVQFGSNNKDNSPFHMISKNINGDRYISNISAKSTVYTYHNTINGYYWNDGMDDIPIVNKSNSEINGIYIKSNGFSFNINNLKVGNKYIIRIYVGVYKDIGVLDVTMNIGSNIYVFEDSTIKKESNSNIPRASVMYEIQIDLTSITISEAIQLIIKWTVKNGNGNITFQAIAFDLING